MKRFLVAIGFEKSNIKQSITFRKRDRLFVHKLA